MTISCRELEPQAINTNVTLVGDPDQRQEPQNPSGTSLKLCFLGSAVLHAVLLTFSFHYPDHFQSPQPKADFIEVELLTVEWSEKTSSESINSHDVEAEKAEMDHTSQIVPPVTKNLGGKPSRAFGQLSHSHSNSGSHSELISSDGLTPLGADMPIATRQDSGAGAIGSGNRNSDASGINSAGTGEASQLTGLGGDPSSSFARGTTLPSLGHSSTYETSEPADTEHIVCLSCPLPDYFGVEGSTRIIYDIAPNGSVTNLRLWESSGDPVIDQTALATVSNWQFTSSKTGRQEVRNRLTFEEVGSAFQQHNRQRRQIELVRLQTAPPSPSSAIRTDAPAQMPFQQHTGPSASIAPTGNSANSTSHTEAASPPASTSPPLLAPPSLPVQTQSSPL